MTATECTCCAFIGTFLRKIKSIFLILHIYKLSIHLPQVVNICQLTSSALVKVMAFCLFGTKPLLEPMLTYCQLGPKDQTSVKFKLKYKIFIHKDAFENVICEIPAILSRDRWVNSRNVYFGYLFVSSPWKTAACFNYFFLTHCCLVMHICVSGLCYHWLRYWLVTCLAPSHYLDQC